MIQHKEQHDDIYADSESPISHADSNHLDNHSLDSTIEEVIKRKTTYLEQKFKKYRGLTNIVF